MKHLRKYSTKFCWVLERNDVIMKNFRKLFYRIIKNKQLTHNLRLTLSFNSEGLVACSLRVFFILLSISVLHNIFLPFYIIWARHLREILFQLFCYLIIVHLFYERSTKNCFINLYFILLFIYR